MNSEASMSERRFYRKADKAMLGGVCAGIADYFGFNLCVTRVLVVIAFLTMPVTLLGYLALAMVLQGTEPWRGRISTWQRGTLLLAAFCLLFPTSLWIDGLGVVLLLAGWLPALRLRPAH